MATNGDPADTNIFSDILACDSMLYLSQLRFIKSSATRQHITDLSKQAKADPIATLACLVPPILHALAGVQTQTPGFPPLNSHQHLYCGGFPGTNKSFLFTTVQLMHTAGIGMALIYAVHAQALTRMDYEQYSDYFSRFDQSSSSNSNGKPDENVNVSNISVARSNCQKKSFMQPMMNVSHGDVESADKWFREHYSSHIKAEIASKTNATVPMNIPQQKCNLIGYKKSIFLKAARRRQLFSEVEVRGGSCIYIETELSAAFKRMNVGKENVMEVVICRLADQKVAGETYTGKQYNIADIDSNETCMMFCGTLQDLVLLFNMMKSGGFSRFLVVLMTNRQAPFHVHEAEDFDQKVLDEWSQFIAANRLLAVLKDTADAPLIVNNNVNGPSPSMVSQSFSEHLSASVAKESDLSDIEFNQMAEQGSLVSDKCESQS